MKAIFKIGIILMLLLLSGAVSHEYNNNTLMRLMAAPAGTLAMGPAAGTSPSVSIEGNGAFGKISLTTGTVGVSAGTVMTMTLPAGISFPTKTNVSFTPVNAAAANVNGLLFSATHTPNTVSLDVMTNLTAGTTYIETYSISGY